MLPISRRSFSPALAAAVQVLLISGQTVYAWPHLFARQTDNNPMPWVTVDADGFASTVTPSISVITATTTTMTTIINGAPAAITGTVDTVPYRDGVSTITYPPSQPQPTGDVAGAFPVCHNTDGKDKPFCNPSAGSQLHPGSSYYFTWDPKFFPFANDSVSVVANYYNETTGDVGDEAFRSPKYLASRGFWTFSIASNLLRGSLVTSETIIIQLITSEKHINFLRLRYRDDSSITTGSNNTTVIKGPVVYITKATGPPATQPFYKPAGPELYIGLPVIGGFIVICVIGGCLWNRKNRRIGLGNVMSRKRHGYGAGKSARSRLRMGNSRKFKEAIQLRERELQLELEQEEQKEQQRRRQEQLRQAHVRHNKPGAGGFASLGGHSAKSSTTEFRTYHDVSPTFPSSPARLRGDDEDLSSLVSTPVSERRMDYGPGSSGKKISPGNSRLGPGASPSANKSSTGNVFRDEMRRQNAEKRLGS